MAYANKVNNNSPERATWKPRAPKAAEFSYNPINGEYSYAVKKGDTLSGILKGCRNRARNDGNTISADLTLDKAAKSNGIKDPNKIFEGQIIKIQISTDKAGAMFFEPLNVNAKDIDINSPEYREISAQIKAEDEEYIARQNGNTAPGVSSNNSRLAKKQPMQ